MKLPNVSTILVVEALVFGLEFFDVDYQTALQIAMAVAGIAAAVIKALQERDPAYDAQPLPAGIRGAPKPDDPKPSYIKRVFFG